MEENGLRRLFESRRLAVGMLIGLPTATIVDIAGCAGINYVMLDTEHATYGLDVLENMASAAKARGVATMVRLANPDPDLMAQVLDIGVDGLKFSKVETREEAEKIISYCRFPPHGERSPEPATRSARYGMMPREEYDRSAGDVAVIVGIDTKKGVENVDEIVAVDGITAVQCGPSDLSWSLGVNRDSKEFIDAVQHVARRARAAGKTPIRVIYSPDQIPEWLKRDPELRVFHWAADKLNIARHFNEGVKKAKAFEAEHIKA
jgi:4-hydroxy-2-oxoheptanedioate aldolase